MTRKQRILFYLAVLTLISLFLLIILSDNGLIDLNSLKKQREAICRENKKIQQEITSLTIEIDRAKNDPVYIEDVARRELGMIGKDEVILKFSTDKKKSKN